MSSYTPNFGKPLESDPWRTAFIKAGCVSPKDGEPSFSALARETGLHVSTISRTISGASKPDPDTAILIADGLGVDFVTVASWLGLAWNEPTEWEPPKEAQFLTRRQRNALDRLIVAMVATDDAEVEQSA